ncbi:MAG TPA: metallophosphoesterase [Vicinamibacteria bacterium]|nr:metallophosphoesterase [Vicinamibacteria bacterium]
MSSTPSRCFFVSDLHGDVDRYRTLAEAAAAERPAAVFLGGDLLPMGSAEAFVTATLGPIFEALREALAGAYPAVLLLLGNDDARSAEAAVLEAEARGLWRYAHLRRLRCHGRDVYGCGFVPPTPFRLKDFERYDVSRFVDPGSVGPEEGVLTTPVAEGELRNTTIAGALDALAGDADVREAVFLLHCPPHGTALDRAALDGLRVEHAPLDVHIGSIAIRRFLEARQPRLALCGHVHESARLTGAWRDRIGGTLCLSAAHDGPELCLVRFTLEDPEDASRELIPRARPGRAGARRP